MFNKLKQVKDLRSKAKELQSKLGEERVEGSAGMGKVRISMDGNHEVISVSIDENALSDKAQLEKNVLEAVNDASKKLQRVLASKMQDLGGMDLAKEMQEMMKK
ncbi:MAG: YbaB/EbfC family nucleoid-associated protein [bacterium]|nr:YbaB/EbfC family nucleoid-associated protein [bacterium]